MSSTPKERIQSYLVDPSFQGFLEALDQVFPERTPPVGADLRDIDVEIGKRQVVRWLLAVKADAEENLLDLS